MEVRDGWGGGGGIFSKLFADLFCLFFSNTLETQTLAEISPKGFLRSQLEDGLCY